VIFHCKNVAGEGITWRWVSKITCPFSSGIYLEGNAKDRREGRVICAKIHRGEACVKALPTRVLREKTQGFVVP